MAGLKGQQRLTQSTPARLRRSQNRLADTNTAFGASSSISIDAEGQVSLNLDGATLEQSGAGLKVTDATEVQRGTVLLQGLVANVTALTDNSGGTSGGSTVPAVGTSITAPADTPADADVLRDDLVANTLPSIEGELSNLRNAVATLSAYCTGLENKINEMLAAQKTASQMSTS